MRHTIEGQHGELLRVELEASEAVIADVGKLVYLRGAVEWNVVVSGQSPAALRETYWSATGRTARGRGRGPRGGPDHTAAGDCS